MYYGNYYDYIELDTVPFDDDKAIYDYDEHRYILKKDWFKARTGFDLDLELNGANETEVFLDETSEALYDIIYETANQENLGNNINVKEYLSAKDTSKRDRIIKALLSYARACLISDIDKIGDESPIDTVNKIRIEIKRFDDVPLQTQRKLLATNLMSETNYRFTIKTEDFRSDY